MHKVITFIDRLDRKYEFVGKVGEPISSFLRHHYIPTSAVVVKVNGKTVDDAVYNVRFDDVLEVRMVRAYQLPEYCQMLDLWNDGVNTRKPASKDSLYTARMLWFNESGICNLRQSTMSDAAFVGWLEKRFLDGILETGLIEPNDHICLALSGGRDSLALLYLLQSVRQQLPPFYMAGVTVSPTAASDHDVRVAAEAMQALGINDYHVLDMSYVNQTMNFVNGFESAIDKGLLERGRGWSISLWHSVMRANIERFCREQGIKKIAFGYQHEDLLASLIRSQSLGVSFGETMHKKLFGRFKLISPLWTITKKELTLYLEQVAPEHHSKQSNPTAYDRGDHNRDINYFLADTLNSICPGIGFTLFQGIADYNRRFKPQENSYFECHNCGAYYQDHNEQDEPVYNKLFCYTCTYFIGLGEIKPITIMETTRCHKN